MARKQKLPAKRPVLCPYCGGRQEESVFALTTICASCGRHYDIRQEAKARPSNAAGHIVLREQRDDAERERSLLAPIAGLAATVFGKKRGPRRVQCFECGARSEVSRAAQSTACPKCGSYIDLQDVTVDRAVSRAIRTQGDLTVTPKGILSSTKAYVGNATIEGAVEGSLVANGRILVKRVGLLNGALHADELEFGKKSRIRLMRSAHARTVVVRGEVEGELHATGSVVVHRRGRLTGTVFARGFRVDKGGEFHGSLKIGGAVPPERSETAVGGGAASSAAQNELPFDESFSPGQA